MFDGIKPSVEPDGPEDGLDGSGHKIEWDLTWLGRVAIDEGINAMKSADVVQVPIGCYLRADLVESF